MAQFKTRARALDLLGRQQIAGIPTAINELIKNAHDAYADHFDIDFIRKDNLLIFRDDGLGMTLEDFESRWLTIGTESKFVKSNHPPVDKSKKRRPIMGEKGIGRLAIASIGKQVLIITKAKQRGFSSKIVVSFINWEIFELPGINLEDIVVPTKEFDTLPDKNDIELIKAEIIKPLEKLLFSQSISQSDFDTIQASINSFQVDPLLFEKTSIGQFSLDGEYNGGTFFYISPVSESLIADIEGNKEDDKATKIEKMLMGFHNTMTPEHPSPAIEISFRDYRGKDGTYFDLIDKDHFFTPKEFNIADHHFIGTFDKYGQFKGSIKVYHEETHNHIVNWSDNQFRETSCGAFSINLAYLQGEAKSSLVSMADYTPLRIKTDKLGGLYIYKNNIRILPYGDSDYDFLDIEKNRSKRASTYFFSYRRMFGVINISNENNPALIEKAGREGFIENKAYRQLQAILKNFFLQIASDFFDAEKKSPFSQYYHEKREEINAVQEAMKRREKQASTRKNNFIAQLNQFFENLSSEKIIAQVNNIIEDTHKNLTSVMYIEDSDEASQKIINLESEARQKLYQYKKSLSLPKATGFTLSRANRLDYETYLNEMLILEETLFKNAIHEIDIIIEKTVSQLNIEISKRKRLEQAINQIAEQVKEKNNKKTKETTELVKDVSNRVNSLTNDLLKNLDMQIRTVKDEFTKLETNNIQDFDLVSKRREMEEKIDRISITNTETMDRIIRQFQGFYIDKHQDAERVVITNEQITDAMIEELDEVREQMYADVELSQLGLAVGILHHEFNSTIRSIRSSLKDLKAWADIEEKLEGVYKNIKINFEHLDGYLNLFTPLDRRLNRRREEIPLLDIKTFLIDLFKSRLERHEIKFKHTNGFSKRNIYGFRSTFYPVFVNLIDNAIYWLNHPSCTAKEKMIRLHADDSGIYISNNGPNIPIQDKEKMFMLGFSRKPNGRGMGLNISKEVLNAEDYTIHLDAPREGSVVTFKIEKIDK